MCKTKRLTILVAWLLGGLLLFLTSGCGSIRVARNAVSSASLRDSMLVNYLRTELETGNLEVQQTIVEFFPPVDTTPETPPDCRNPTEDAAPAIGAVKRVVRTELSARREQAVVVDSSSVSGKQMEENSEENTEKHSEVNEPPSATKLNVTLKALAVLLALLIICYGIIQYRINLYKKMKTPISYYGGKQSILKHILPLIPEHTLYTEAFCGGCSVLFAIAPCECEVINDVNAELINFYKIAKERYPELKTLIDSTLHSREIHAHAKHINAHPEFFNPVERAWAVWVCSKLGFASMLDGTFGYDRQGTTTKKLRNAKDDFTETLCGRLDHVTIECENGINMLKRYDCEGAFHFVDPPYVGTDCAHYNGTFNEQDFEELLEVLSNCKGKFMLTMFPHPRIREYADRFGWKIHTLDRTITASKTSRRRQEEWITCNYEIAQPEKAPEATDAGVFGDV